MLNSPFRYNPSPEVVRAAWRLISDIRSDDFLRSLFKEKKMLGVLVVEAPATVADGFAATGVGEASAGEVAIGNGCIAATGVGEASAGERVLARQRER